MTTTAADGRETREKLAGTDCVHCGLPLPPPDAIILDDEGHGFCCTGCRAVYEMIHGEGLEAFYTLRGEEEGAIPHRSGRSFEEFDDEEFTRIYVRPLGPEDERAGGRPALLSTELFLEGVHCTACIWLVEKLPRLVEGVHSARLDFARQVVDVTWDPGQVKLSEVARALDRLGYAPHPARGGREREQRRVQDRAELIRLGIAGVCAMNAMLIAFALYGGMLQGMTAQYRDYFRIWSLIIAAVAVFFPGRVFLRGAIASPRARAAHVDLPVAVGILAGLVGGAYNTFSGQGEVYFESVSILIFFLLAGRFVQNRQQRSARDSLELLHSLTPGRARRLEPDGSFKEVPVAALKPGDRVELRSGDSVPADGRLVEGASAFDLSLISGESRPVELGEGGEVLAGTVNLQARVLMEVDAVGEATRLGRLLGLVESAASRAVPMVRLADRIAGKFTAAVLFLAILTLAIWWRSDRAQGIESAVALLIVACPCALGLATPLAIVAAVGKAARRGILIQGGEVLERLAKPGLVWLDKTGTLTRGELALERWWGAGEERAWVRELELHSSHPLATALVDALDEGNAARQRPRVSEVREVLGRGIRARSEAGEDLLVGSPAFLEAEGVERPPEFEAALKEALAEAWTPVLAARGGIVVALAGMGDPIIEDAEPTIRSLEERGWSVGILSGDHPEVVRAVGRRLGLEPKLLRGGVDPEGKAKAVLEASGAGTVVMVGDGVNDAAALAAATTGIAVEGGAEASMEAADAYLSQHGIAPVAALLEGARRTIGVIRRGLLISILYNGVAVYLAMTGRIDPIWAAILMPVSSLTVVSVAYRSRTF